MKCEKCGSEMVYMIYTSFCPNDCDKEEKESPKRWYTLCTVEDIGTQAVFLFSDDLEKIKEEMTYYNYKIVAEVEPLGEVTIYHGGACFPYICHEGIKILKEVTA